MVEVLVYKAWFSTGYIKVARKLWGRDETEVSNLAAISAQKLEWKFLDEMEFIGSLEVPENAIHLERCLELSL